MSFCSHVTSALCRSHIILIRNVKGRDPNHWTSPDLLFSFIGIAGSLTAVDRQLRSTSMSKNSLKGNIVDKALNDAKVPQGVLLYLVHTIHRSLRLRRVLSYLVDNSFLYLLFIVSRLPCFCLVQGVETATGENKRTKRLLYFLVRTATEESIKTKGPSWFPPQPFGY